MSEIKNKSILVTGGASGIGKLMVKLLLKEEAKKVIIWDKNEKQLTETLKELATFKERVYGTVIDLQDTTAIQKEAELLGTVDHLINNAGVVIGKYFHEHSHADVDFTMNINSSAVMHTALAFLPKMIAQKSGHIVNISSAAGLVANPRMSVYCASKWSVVGWSESLYLEMKRLKTGVQVTTVTPYYINTGMFDGVKSVIPIQNADKAAKKIIRALKNNKRVLRFPLIIYTLGLVKGLLPKPLFDWFVGGVLGVYKTMDKFTGRKEK